MTAGSPFTGSVPENYDRFLGPVLFEPVADHTVARLDRPLRVLEVACGTGILTRRLRAALDSGSTLVATDLSEPMIDYARAKVDTAGVEWRQADAQALPFRDGNFDAYVCQFGLMFPPDKVAVLREARRVLAPGGRLYASVWGSIPDNAHMSAAVDAVDRALPDDPPRFFDTPHGYHDVETIRADFAAAGWPTVEIDDVRLRSETPSARDFATGIAKGSPVTHEISERGVVPESLIDSITAEVAARCGDDPFVVELVFLLVTAER